MNGAQLVMAEARPRHHAGGEVLNYHVHLRYDRPDELTAARLLDIDGQAFFRVIVLEKVRALRARLEYGIARLVAGGAAAVAVWRQLQLDDLGAQLRQYPCASRTGDELGHVEHAIAREHRQFGTHRPLAALIRKEKVRDGRLRRAAMPLRLPCRRLRGQPPPAAVRAAQAGRNPRTARPRTGRT